LKTVTLSLDEKVVTTITKLARRLGVSRSAFVNTILSESQPHFETMLAFIPEEGEELDPKRYRGAAIDIMTEQYKKMVQEVIEFPSSGDKPK
jgi:lambda repressor-like predicted transcriptional regulator